jgi:predicted DNA binding CopG/RHH family protein
MRKKKIDPDMPIGKMTRIKDFLPPPEDLIMPEKTVKVTILLSESSVDSFKKFAEKHHTKYQKIIRKILDKYAQRYLEHS